MDKSILSERKIILLQEKNALESVLLQEQKKYFHLITVSNLIEHYTEIKNVSDQEWVFKSLQEYFNTSLNIAETIDRDLSQTLYNDYLSKITNYYDRHLKFSFFLDIWIVVALYCVLFFGSLFFIKFIVSLIASALLCLLNLYYLLSKYRQKRTYGIFH